MRARSASALAISLLLACGGGDETSTSAGAGGTGSTGVGTSSSGGSTAQGSGGAGQGGSNTSVGGSGTGGMGTGGMGTGGSGTGGMGTGGAGGGLLQHTLVNDGLVVRYYLDEAASGTAPTTVGDAAPNPLDLNLNYANAVMSFTEDAAGHRGLLFADWGLDDRASIAVDGTKLGTEVHAHKTITLEAVVDIEGVSGSGTRLIHFGSGTESRLTLELFSTSRIDLYWNDSDRLAEGVYDLSAGNRVVVHAVIDTAQADADARAMLYVNGAPLAKTINSPPVQDEVVNLSTGRHFVIGNREIGDRSPEGIIYYAAVYNQPLDAMQRLQNIATLLVDDDTPIP
jgi:hypothetical protein